MVILVVPMSPNWFQFDPNGAPDTDFERGELHHLCVGNEGRLLDFRRTPVRVIRVCDETGLATVEILKFEDKGALWDVPYEEVGKYQFKKGCPRASAEALDRIAREAARLNRQVEILCESQRDQTLATILQERERAGAWLASHSRFFQSGNTLPQGEPEGSPLLYADTQDYMAHRGFGDLEAYFTRHYVSHMLNEAVKAHRIAVAQLGLAPYVGKILRDPVQTFGALGMERRTQHIMARMGFVQAMFERAEQSHIVLYRMESCEGPLRLRRLGDTALVSASFRMDIVQEMSGWADVKRTVAIYRQSVPVERVLMTYLETEAMNHPYREAEAVLLTDPTNQAF